MQNGYFQILNENSMQNENLKFYAERLNENLKFYAERLFSNIKRKLKITIFYNDQKDHTKDLIQKFAFNAEHQFASKRNQFLPRALQSLSNNTAGRAITRSSLEQEV